MGDAGWWSGSSAMSDSQSYTRTFGAAATVLQRWQLFADIAVPLYIREIFIVKDMGSYD